MSYLMTKDLIIPLSSRKRQRYPLSPLLYVQHYTEGSSPFNKARKRNKGIRKVENAFFSK